MSLSRQKVRNDIVIRLQLYLNGVPMSWNRLQELNLFMKNDSQLGWIGKCEIIAITNTGYLDVLFKGSESSYAGINRIVVAFVDEHGRRKEIDSPVFMLVEKSSDLELKAIDYDLGNEDGTQITTEEGLVIAIGSETYKLINS